MRAFLFGGAEYPWWRFNHGGRWARIWKRGSTTDPWEYNGWKLVPECPARTGQLINRRGECTTEKCLCEVWT